MPGGGVAPKDASALLLNAMSVAPEHEHEFNDWYDTEHLPALAAVPGTLYARRYRGTGAAAQRYLALYYLTSAEIPNSTAWKAAANTPWTERMRPHFRDHLRMSSALSTMLALSAARRRTSRSLTAVRLPLMALSDQSRRARVCPLLDNSRHQAALGPDASVAIDPKATLHSSSTIRAKGNVVSIPQACVRVALNTGYPFPQSTVLFLPVPPWWRILLLSPPISQEGAILGKKHSDRRELR